MVVTNTPNIHIRPDLLARLVDAAGTDDPESVSAIANKCLAEVMDQHPEVYGRPLLPRSPDWLSGIAQDIREARR